MISLNHFVSILQLWLCVFYDTPRLQSNAVYAICTYPVLDTLLVICNLRPVMIKLFFDDGGWNYFEPLTTFVLSRAASERSELIGLSGYTQKKIVNFV